MSDPNNADYQLRAEAVFVAQRMKPRAKIKNAPFSELRDDEASFKSLCQAVIDESIRVHFHIRDSNKLVCVYCGVEMRQSDVPNFTYRKIGSVLPNFPHTDTCIVRDAQKLKVKLDESPKV
jgi:hypothetical protein